MGQLTLKSFIDNGHEADLWVYNKECAGVPNGVNIKDAGEILNPERIYSYKGYGDCRDGSYGGFSDLFRYYLLKEVGGWYSDMDVTCLKNFESINEQKFVIKPYSSLKYTGNIIKTPKNHPFLLTCIEETEKNVDENNSSWIKPVEIFNSCIEIHKLQKFVVPESYFGCDSLQELFNYLKLGYTKDENLPEYAIHWCNEAVSSGRWSSEIKRNWNKPLPTTLYYKLLKKHSLL
jgi:hypothetical protein